MEESIRDLMQNSKKVFLTLMIIVTVGGVLKISEASAQDSADAPRGIAGDETTVWLLDAPTLDEPEEVATLTSEYIKREAQRQK